MQQLCESMLRPTRRNWLQVLRIAALVSDDAIGYDRNGSSSRNSRSGAVSVSHNRLQTEVLGFLRDNVAELTAFMSSSSSPSSPSVKTEQNGRENKAAANFPELPEVRF